MNDDTKLTIKANFPPRSAEEFSAAHAERREFCKQHLLPRTGDAKLDDLIRQARLQEFAKVAMVPVLEMTALFHDEHWRTGVALDAISAAKALAAKLDEEGSSDD
jgi:hypothetical protein